MGTTDNFQFPNGFSHTILHEQANSEHEYFQFPNGFSQQIWQV